MTTHTKASKPHQTRANTQQNGGSTALSQGYRRPPPASKLRTNLCQSDVNYYTIGNNMKHKPSTTAGPRKKASTQP